ncbi:MAG: hypothetical protein HY362_01155 [Candidatus Aenigmarchaeota archaeon]|nr:hypothetical protein [Candidatus Aenigmarchaeota archaeon]
MKGIIVFALVVVLAAGCTGQSDPASVAKGTEIFKNFLSSFPNSTVTAVFLDNNTISNNIGNIRQSCGEQMEIKPYWRVIASTPENKSSLTVWMDSFTNQPLCFVALGLQQDILSPQQYRPDYLCMIPPANSTCTFPGKYVGYTGGINHILGFSKGNVSFGERVEFTGDLLCNSCSGTKLSLKIAGENESSRFACTGSVLGECTISEGKCKGGFDVPNSTGSVELTLCSGGNFTRYIGWLDIFSGAVTTTTTTTSSTTTTSTTTTVPTTTTANTTTTTLNTTTTTANTTTTSTTSTTTTTQAPKPDFVVGNASVRYNYTENYYRIYLTVNNTGTAASTGFLVNLTLSNSSGTIFNTTKLNHAGLTVNQSYVFSFLFLNSTVSNGPLNSTAPLLAVKLDDLEEVSELNETNNIATLNLTTTSETADWFRWSSG